MLKMYEIKNIKDRINIKKWEKNNDNYIKIKIKIIEINKIEEAKFEPKAVLRVLKLTEYIDVAFLPCVSSAPNIKL